MGLSLRQTACVFDKLQICELLLNVLHDYLIKKRSLCFKTYSKTYSDKWSKTYKSINSHWELRISSSPKDGCNYSEKWSCLERRDETEQSSLNLTTLRSLKHSNLKGRTNRWPISCWKSQTWNLSLKSLNWEGNNLNIVKIWGKINCCDKWYSCSTNSNPWRENHHSRNRATGCTSRSCRRIKASGRNSLSWKRTGLNTCRTIDWNEGSDSVWAANCEWLGKEIWGGRWRLWWWMRRSLLARRSCYYRKPMWWLIASKSWNCSRWNQERILRRC